MEKANFSNNGFQVLKEVEQSRIETKNHKEVNVGEVKCPLCGEKMRVSSYSLPNKEEEYSSSSNIGHMSLEGEMYEIFTWTCPICHAELKAQVKHSFKRMQWLIK